MRGQRSLFQSLFPDPPPPITPERKGRSEALKQAQDALIVCRYYYLVKLQGMHYGPALERLQAEHYLTTTTLIKIISREQAALKSLQAEKPEAKAFAKRYPWISWVG